MNRHCVNALDLCWRVFHQNISAGSKNRGRQSYRAAFWGHLVYNYHSYQSAVRHRQCLALKRAAVVFDQSLDVVSLSVETFHLQTKMIKLKTRSSYEISYSCNARTMVGSFGLHFQDQEANMPNGLDNTK